MSEYGPQPENARENLLEQLSFETEELLSLKSEARALYQQGEVEAGHQKYLEYRAAAETEVDRLEGDLPKVGLLVKVALFFREVGDTERYSEELDGAIEYAVMLGRDDIAEQLTTI